MTAFEPFPNAPARDGLPARAARLPGWPRLMGERMAADYLSIGTTQLRDKGPKAKKIGGRTLWDRRDLDRFADALAGQPLDEAQAESHAKHVERDWLEGRKKRKGQANGR